MKQHEVLHQVKQLEEAKILEEDKKKKHHCPTCPFRTIQKSHLERHMYFHDKANFSTKKGMGYYRCKHCEYFSSNTGKMKQHEVLHIQLFENVIDKVIADADTEDENRFAMRHQNEVSMTEEDDNFEKDDEEDYNSVNEHILRKNDEVENNNSDKE